MTRVLRGIIHGKTIELEYDTGLEDGQSVEVILRADELTNLLPLLKREGVKTSAGMMAEFWTDEDDRILAEIHQDRKKESLREIRE